MGAILRFPQKLPTNASPSYPYCAAHCSQASSGYHQARPAARISTCRAFRFHQSDTPFRLFCQIQPSSRVSPAHRRLFQRIPHRRLWWHLPHRACLPVREASCGHDGHPCCAAQPTLMLFDELKSPPL